MPTVMVIDDAEMHRETLARLLRREGYDTLIAPDANAALHTLRGRRPDLILLDINMPDVNGLDLLEMLHDNVAWRAIPVVMLTACSDTHCIRRAEQLGAKAYLVKATFSIGDMLKHVHDYAGGQPEQ